MRCHVRPLTLVLLVVFSVATARTQTLRSDSAPADTAPATKACNHDGYDLWDEMKVLPVRFTEFDRKTASWKYQDDRVMKLGSFALTDSAQYRSQDDRRVRVDYLMQHKEAIWLCYYCAHCHTLLVAYELKPGALTLN